MQKFGVKLYFKRAASKPRHISDECCRGRATPRAIATPHPRLRVELLDNREAPLPGYSGESTIPVRESGLDRPVAWKGHDRISGLKSPFKIKVSFEGEQSRAVRFYAAYLQQ